MGRTSVRLLVAALVASVATVAVGVPHRAQPAAVGWEAPVYDRVALGDGAGVVCRADDGPAYAGGGSTFAPLVRGPLYAPTTFWIDRDRLPVSPLVSNATIAATWRTVDSGSALAGTIRRSVVDRPLAGGPTATYSGRTVACTWRTPPRTALGTYRMTAHLASALGLPRATIGRSVSFVGGGTTQAVTPRYLFPSTATVLSPTLPTPTGPRFGRLWFPRPWSEYPLSTQTVNGGIACEDRDTRAPVYRGSAWTLAPLVRGDTWSPVSFWLKDGRLAMPSWFWSYTGDGVWTTVDAGPVASGPYSAYQEGRPGGYGALPAWGTDIVECRWDNPIHAVVTVTPALVEQLSLPPELVGRRVDLLREYSQTYAYVPGWMFRT